MDWVQTVFDGVAGGIIGSLGAFAAAIFVVKRQSRSDREIAQRERRMDSLTMALNQFNRLDTIVDGLMSEIKHSTSLERFSQRSDEFGSLAPEIILTTTIVDPEISFEYTKITRRASEALGVYLHDGDATKCIEALEKYQKGLWIILTALFHMTHEGMAKPPTRSRSFLGRNDASPH